MNSDHTHNLVMLVGTDRTDAKMTNKESAKQGEGKFRTNVRAEVEKSVENTAKPLEIVERS